MLAHTVWIWGNLHLYERPKVVTSWKLVFGLSLSMCNNRAFSSGNNVLDISHSADISALVLAFMMAKKRVLDSY